MLGALRAAKLSVLTPTLYDMEYVVNEPIKDDYGDVVGEGEDSDPICIKGKIVYKSARMGLDGSGTPEGYELTIQKHSAEFEPCAGARVTPTCGPFCGQCFIIAAPDGQDIRLDSTGAIYKLRAYHG